MISTGADEILYAGRGGGGSNGFTSSARGESITTERGRGGMVEGAREETTVENEVLSCSH